MPCLMDFRSIIEQAPEPKAPLNHPEGIEGYRRAIINNLRRLISLLEEGLTVEKIESEIRNYIDDDCDCYIKDRFLNLKAAEKIKEEGEGDEFLAYTEKERECREKFKKLFAGKSVVTFFCGWDTDENVDLLRVVLQDNQGQTSLITAYRENSHEYDILKEMTLAATNK